MTFSRLVSALRYFPLLVTIALGVGMAACFSSSGGPPGDAFDGGLGFDSTTPGDDAASPTEGSTAPDVRSSADTGSTPDAADATSSEGGPGDATVSDSATADATPGEASAPDGAVTIATGSIPSAKIFGAASNDGSAMLLLSNAPDALDYSHYEPGSGWSALAPVPGGTLTTSPPVIGMDASGNAWVMWLHSTTGVVSLNAVRYDHAGGTWGAVQQPDPYAMTLAQVFAASVNASGDVVVLDFRAGATGALDLYAQHYTAGSWTPELVQTYATGATWGQAAVALADNGVAVVTWRESQTNYVALRSTAGTWSVPSGVTFSATGQPAATMNAAGDALVGFEDTAYYPWAVHYNAATTSWIGPRTVGTVGEGSVMPLCPLDVGIGPSGDGVLVRCFNGGSPRTLQSFTYTKAVGDGGTWAAPVSLPTVAWPYNQSFAFDKAGAGLAVWSEGPTSSAATSPAMASVYTPDAGWSAASPPLGAAFSTPFPAAFVSPNGHAYVAWIENNATLKVEQIR